MALRWRALAAACAAAVALGAGLASASTLGVVSPGVSAAVAHAPCGGQVTVSGPSATTLGLTLSDATCVGRTVAVTVLTGTTVLTQATVVPTATSTQVTVPPYTAPATATALATVDGWSLPAAWVGAGSVVPGTSSTVLVGSPEWYTAWDGRSCVRVTASTSTSQQVVWAVDLLVTQPPFPGTAAAYTVVDGSGQVGIAANPPAGVVRLVGKNGNETLKAGQSRTFSVCW